MNATLERPAETCTACGAAMKEWFVAGAGLVLRCECGACRPVGAATGVSVSEARDRLRFDMLNVPEQWDDGHL